MPAGIEKRGARVPRLIVYLQYTVLTLIIMLPCLAWAWSGKVFGVSDGDTIKVMRAHKEVKIRLYGIDCPERSQPFTRKAKQFTSDMVFGKIVEVHRMDTDRCGRTLALLAVDKQLLNEELIKSGYAWV
jgi:endonuclease YncB( thermonuclease family)